MNYIREKVAYLKGLAEGMQISDSTNEGKLLKAIIDVLDDVAHAVEDLEEVQEQISEQMDSMDEDLAEVESVIFGEDEDEDEDEEEDGCDCEDCIGEFECPHCNQLVCLTEEMFDKKGDKIKCPNCQEEIEVEWDCDCENCEDSEE